MTLFFWGLWLLCGVGSAILAADAVRRGTTLATFVVGFGAAAIALRPDRLPDLTTIAGVLLIVAFARLVRPTAAAAIAASAAGGVVAATWATLFQLQGLALLVALPIAVLVPVLSAWMSWRDFAFAPPPMYEEALVLLAAFAAVLAVAPGIAAGWQSAMALNLEEKRAVAQSVPNWTVVVMVLSVSLGGAYSIWTRR